MSELCEVAENVYLIDTEEGSIPRLTATYLLNEGKKALIDTGSPNSAGTILNSIKRLGVDPNQICYLVITHVHVDHAGGAGILSREMTQAEVLVHPRGAKHLVDPSKLTSSAMQVLSREEMERYGSMVPLSPEKVRVLDDDAIIELNSHQRLRVIYTPGHAPHHLSLWEERNKGLFAGDALGEYVPGAEFLFVDTPAPSFDLPSALESIEKARQLPVQLVYFSHFGVSRRVEEILGVAESKLKLWGEVVYGAMKNNRGDLEENLRQFIEGELRPIRDDKDHYRIWAAWATESIRGYVDYFERIAGKESIVDRKGE